MQANDAPTANPFHDDPECLAHEELRSRALEGDHHLPELLRTRHLPWFFSLSIRMLHRRADAKDATQEILLKAMSALSSFRGKAKCRTRHYRIAVNQLLPVRKNNSHSSDPVCSFPKASSRLRQVPDLDPPAPRTVPVPLDILNQETGNNCIIGTLLCLDGCHRLVFILGEIFEVSHKVGADICEITPRQLLPNPLARAARHLPKSSRQQRPHQSRKSVQVCSQDQCPHSGLLCGPQQP